VCVCVCVCVCEYVCVDFLCGSIFCVCEPTAFRLVLNYFELFNVFEY
jgi:hypothetical protein